MGISDSSSYSQPTSTHSSMAPAPMQVTDAPRSTCRVEAPDLYEVAAAGITYAHPLAPVITPPAVSRTSPRRERTGSLRGAHQGPFLPRPTLNSAAASTALAAMPLTALNGQARRGPVS